VVWLPDFFPTAAGLAGADFLHEVNGTDLWPLLGGNQGDFQPHQYLYFSKNREQAVRMGAWKAYRESPDHPIRLYLVEEDTYGERDLSSCYPGVVRTMETIMDTSYTPHEWYWTPNETSEEYQKKIDKARETGNLLPVLRPNSVENLPWD
jgi:arylsulfatase A-like enzyme